MTQEMQAKLIELHSDIDKIIEAANAGYVEVGYGDEQIPYTMSGNALNDICGLWQNLHMILLLANMEQERK